ncbi:GGDEF domain-containing protein [bacterium]|nr:GGDEF domain-containing protein [bacterium]
MRLDLYRQLRDHFAVIKLSSIIAVWALFQFLVVSSSTSVNPLYRSPELANALPITSLSYIIITLAFWAIIFYDESFTEKIHRSSLVVDVAYLYYMTLTFPDFHSIFLLGFIALLYFHSFQSTVWTRLGTLTATIVIYCSAALGWPFYRFPGNDLIQVSQVIASLWILSAAAYFGWKLIEQQQRMIGTLDKITVELLDTTLSTEISNEELKQRNKEITTLLQINEIISSSLEWEALFTNIILALKNSFIFKNFTLFLYDEVEEKLSIRIANGVFYDEDSSYKITPGEGIAGWTFQNRSSVCVADVSHDHRFKEFSSSKAIPASLLCVPLIYRGTAIGVISLDSATTGNFTRKDQKFLESIAYLISVAITNSKHYSTVKEESITDNLTGLANFRELQNRFNEILEKNIQSKDNLSVMMIDIDHFKKVNDTYGHLAGNRILKALSDLFRNYFRKTDVPARYGGEEFAIILQGSPLSAAKDMAESLRYRVSREDFFIDDERNYNINLTVSIGVSSFEDENIQRILEYVEKYDLGELSRLQIQLIKNADEALYYAKNKGRNIVVTWQQVESLRQDDKEAEIKESSGDQKSGETP